MSEGPGSNTVWSTNATDRLWYPCTGYSIVAARYLAGVIISVKTEPDWKTSCLFYFIFFMSQIDGLEIAFRIWRRCLASRWRRLLSVVCWVSRTCVAADVQLSPRSRCHSPCDSADARWQGMWQGSLWRRQRLVCPYVTYDGKYGSFIPLNRLPQMVLGGWAFPASQRITTTRRIILTAETLAHRPCLIPVLFLGNAVCGSVAESRR